MEMKKLKEMVAALAAMEVSLLRLIRGDIGTTEEVLRAYADNRNELGFPLSDDDFARLLHMVEQSDADDFKGNRPNG